MKKGWEIKKLGELSNKKDAVVSGPFGSNLKVSDYKNHGIPILRLQNIGKGFFIDKDIKFISEEKAEELKYHSFLSGDIALAKLGIPIGKTCIIPNNLGSGIITADIVRIRPDINIVNYNYLEYYLNTDQSVNQLTTNISGATRPRVNLSDVRDIKIPLPPLPEQQRIVSILDQAFAAIARAKANAEQNLKNAAALFESYLQGVFENKGAGWEEKTLGEIAFVKSGGTPLRHKTEYWSGDIAWYSSGELNNLYTTNPERHINELAIENSNAKLFPKGSLLIGMYDTAALKMSILDRDGTFNQAIAGVKPNPKIDLIFILHAINAIKPEILNLRRGVRQKNLSLEKIKNILISLPSLKEQQTIIRQLDALRAETQKLEAVYQKKIDDLEELKKSILQKAFSGAL